MPMNRASGSLDREGSAPYERRGENVTLHRRGENQLPIAKRKRGSVALPDDVLGYSPLVAGAEAAQLSVNAQ